MSAYVVASAGDLIQLAILVLGALFVGAWWAARRNR